MSEESETIGLPRFSRRIGFLDPGRVVPTDRPAGPMGVLPTFAGLLNLQVEPANPPIPTFSYLALQPLVAEALAAVDRDGEGGPSPGRTDPSETDAPEGRKVYQILRSDAGSEAGRETLTRGETDGPKTSRTPPANRADGQPLVQRQRDVLKRTGSDDTYPAAAVGRREAGSNGPGTPVESGDGKAGERLLGAACHDVRPAQSDSTAQSTDGTDSQDGTSRSPTSGRIGDTAVAERKVGRESLGGRRPDMTLSTTMTATHAETDDEGRGTAPRQRAVIPSRERRPGLDRGADDGHTAADTGPGAATIDRSDSRSGGPAMTVRTASAGDDSRAQHGSDVGTARESRMAGTSTDAAAGVDHRDVSQLQSDPPLGRGVDLDRLVDRMYGKLERKMRTERERRGL